MDEQQAIDGKDSDPVFDSDVPLAPGPDAGAQITSAVDVACEQIDRAIELLRSYQNTLRSEGHTLAEKTGDFTSTARRITSIFSRIADGATRITRI